MANTININVSKVDLGLDQVNNTSDLNKPISTATQIALNGKENLTNKSTDVNLGTSNTLYPTQNAVKVYTDSLLGNANALIYKGILDCSANPNYPSANAGELYIVSVAGKIGGTSGVNVEVGDMLICNTDSTASGNQATVGSYWNAIQKNIDGAVTGPSSSTNNKVVVFDGATGKIIKEGIITDNGNNVGVGISSPNAKLHIHNTGIDNSLLIEDENNPDTTPFIIDNHGRVGIGTSNLTHKLSVSGGAVTADNYYINGATYAQVSHRYVKQVAGLVSGTWTNICNVLGDSLSSGVRISIMGDAGSTVVDVVADILVNHSQDIFIESKSGAYTLLTLRVISDDNQNFTIQATTNSVNSLTANVEVFPLNSELVIFDSITPYSGMLLQHECVSGLAISSTDGVTSDIGNINTKGSVGIGTNPTAKLHVVKGLQSDTISVSNSAAYIAGVDVGLAIGHSAGAPYGIWLQSLRSSDNATFPLLLNPNGGSVGVGTATPSVKLEINGDIKVSTIANATSNTDKFLVSDSGVVKHRTASQVKSDLTLNNVDNTSDFNKPISSATQTALDNKSDKNITLDRKTASYTLVASDNGKMIEMNVASANTLTIDASIFSAGNQILISQYGAGQTTITAGAGVTLRSSGGKLKTSAQYSLVTIIAISSTEFYVAGDLTA